MELTIERVKCFDLPEGHFRVRLSECKPLTKYKQGTPQEYCRLVFEVVQGPHEYKCAGRNFLPTLRSDSQLRDFLESWLGLGYFEKTSVRKFKVDSLIGSEADIVIRHIVNSENIKPFCQVAAIYPAGTLIAQPPHMKGLAT